MNDCIMPMSASLYVFVTVLDTGDAESLLFCRIFAFTYRHFFASFVTCLLEFFFCSRYKAICLIGMSWNSFKVWLMEAN